MRLSCQLVEHISALWRSGHTEIRISATIGIALYPEHSKDEQELIQLEIYGYVPSEKQHQPTLVVF